MQRFSSRVLLGVRHTGRSLFRAQALIGFRGRLPLTIGVLGSVSLAYFSGTADCLAQPDSEPTSEGNLQHDSATKSDSNVNTSPKDVPVEAEEAEKSEKPYQHPQHANLTVLVADKIEEVVYNSDKDVMVYVYTPWCTLCRKLSLVFHDLAATMDGEDSVVLAQMNGDANFKEGFLTKEEAEGFPTLKFFPAKGGEPVSYRVNRLTTADLLKFIHEHAKNKFDLESALARASERHAALLASITEAVEKELKSYARKSNEGALGRKSPCGDLEKQCHKLLSLNPYRNADERPGKWKEFEKLISEYQLCEVGDESLRYWQSITELSQKKLDDIHEMKVILEKRKEKEKEVIEEKEKEAENAAKREEEKTGTAVG